MRKTKTNNPCLVCPRRKNCCGDAKSCDKIRLWAWEARNRLRVVSGLEPAPRPKLHADEIYTVRRHETGDIIAVGTSKKCCAILNISEKALFMYLFRTREGQTRRFDVEVVEDGQRTESN